MNLTADEQTQTRCERERELNRLRVKKFNSKPENKAKKLEYNRKRRAILRAECAKTPNCPRVAPTRQLGARIRQAEPEQYEYGYDDYGAADNDYEEYVEPAPARPVRATTRATTRAPARQPAKRQPAGRQPAPAPEPEHDPNEPPGRPADNSPYTLDDCRWIINNVDVTNKPLLQPKSKTAYRGHIKRFFAETGGVDLKHSLAPNNYKATLKKINNSKNYDLRTQLGMYQIILKFIDPHHYNITGKLFSATHNAKLLEFTRTKFIEYKAKSAEITLKDKDKEVPSFKWYLKQCKKIFHEDSKEYLIAYLYYIFTLRDNFQNLKLITYERENIDKKQNYLLHTPKKTIFYINVYKTAAKNGHKKYPLLKRRDHNKLRSLITAYLKKNEGATTLFGKGSLSTIAGKMHRKLEVKQEAYTRNAIGLFRSMKVTDVLKDPNLTIKKRVELAEVMGHSPAMQLNYERTSLMEES